MKTDYNDSTPEITVDYLEPLIKFAFKMLQSGTLKKNAIKHFTNKGLSFEASENIVEMAECDFEKFTHYNVR